ncbi:hypothetical protein SynA1562_00526 [Synechococcus sp. A15-62]|nr:hypothetical protein SynA1562_00526 [Synechococcus sp. A15-62]
MFGETRWHRGVLQLKRSSGNGFRQWKQPFRSSVGLAIA